MSDPVVTPSDNPNQPAVVTPAPAAASAVTPPAVPTVTPAPIETTPAAAAATPETPAPAEVTPPETPKPAEPAAAAAKPDEPAAPPVVPEAYEIQLPKALVDKGLKVDSAFVSALTPALKQAGLTQQQLNTIAGSFIEYQTKLPAMMLERDLAVTMKDAEIGGLNYGRTQGHVNAALTAFTTPEFRSLLNQTGLANNLEFVRVFERIGKAMTGDSPARGTPDGAPQLSRAEKMYGKTSPTQ